MAIKQESKIYIDCASEGNYVDQITKYVAAVEGILIATHDHPKEAPTTGSSSHPQQFTGQVPKVLTVDEPVPEGPQIPSVPGINTWVDRGMEQGWAQLQGLRKRYIKQLEVVMYITKRYCMLMPQISDTEEAQFKEMANALMRQLNLKREFCSPVLFKGKMLDGLEEKLEECTQHALYLNALRISALLRRGLWSLVQDFKSRYEHKLRLILRWIDGGMSMDISVSERFQTIVRFCMSLFDLTGYEHMNEFLTFEDFATIESFVDVRITPLYDRLRE